MVARYAAATDAAAEPDSRHVQAGAEGEDPADSASARLGVGVTHQRGSNTPVKTAVFEAKFKVVFADRLPVGR